MKIWKGVRARRRFLFGVMKMSGPPRGGEAWMLFFGPWHWIVSWGE